MRHSEQCFTPRRCFEVPPIGSMEIDEGAVARTGPVDALRTSLKLAGTFLLCIISCDFKAGELKKQTQ